MADTLTTTAPNTHDPLDRLVSWHASWRGLRTLVLGLGVTGFAAADTLAELGADVLVAAEHAEAGRRQMLDAIGARLLETELRAVPGEVRRFAPEVIIASPGFHPDHALLSWAGHAGIPVWGDIELAWRLRDKTGRPADWLAVTGTDGKTTTVQLSAEILRQAGLRVAPCGNIGVPVLDAIRDPQGFDVLVVELSSYQLHWTNRNAAGALSPYASVCLNIAPDHLDWHGSFENYRAAKARVYENTRVACVYNKADEATVAMVREAEVVAGARAIGFGRGAPGPGDLGVVGGVLCDRAFLDDRAERALELTTLDELAGRGLAAPHLVEDVLAAAALTRSYGVAPEVIHEALTHFTVDQHRVETVAVRGGTRWVDDSKATNPHAAAAALTAFPRIVWLVGGAVKGVDVGPLVEKFAPRLRAAVILGADRAAFRAAFRRHAPQLPVFEIQAADTEEIMRQAVEYAAGKAGPGDTVLLAPAAASTDQFANYAQRGSMFAAAVRALPAAERPAE
ncbi:MAG TPA: UDP-N-acetylmuramoyl-L-alanine--D-glutamate ligase [Microbacteriaceae bacterium]|nr:UDP-N-acetylmuramoyl-L-alanine--D-glutamate ligase [Microbacteriaceae bacterium]